MIAKRIAFLVLLASLLGANNATDPDLSAITERNLKAHVRFLAHDLLEGRGTASRGYDLAALYVATQFEQVGLIPVSTFDGYLQDVPLRKTDVLTDNCRFSVLTKEGPIDLQYGVDYLMPGDYAREQTEVTADLVFAGFGVTAPELGYDDYAGLDVKGKIVLLLSSSPETFPTSERAHYYSSTTKQKNAVQHGAVGIISFQNPVDELRTPWDRAVRQNKLPGYRWMESQDQPHDVPPEILVTASLSHSAAEKLFSHTSVSLQEIFAMWKEKKLRSFSLNLRASLKRSSKLANVRSSNVIGLLEGSDSNLKKEYVVYTAHLDHLGISDPVQNDTINNGAYDNATGIAALIEVARAFALSKQKPRRSILFVAVTAEEKGLQGADYFVHRPPVSVDSIVANVNTDMFLMLYPFADAVALGWEHSTLGPIADHALQIVGLKRSPDPAPEEARFVRSDQYAFIKKGIPAIKFVAGFESLNPSVNGAEATRKWLRAIYHSPQDESNQNMHWESGIKIVQATFVTGHEIANQTARPSWNPGDFFGKTFAGTK